MANYLILNTNQVFLGTGTLSYTVPTTGAYNVQVQCNLPAALATGSNAGSGQGLGSGTGGGGEGFTGGDLGTGHGGVGQGFGTGNSYQQPSSQPSNQSSGSAITSGLSIVINQNGSPIYTSPTPGVIERILQFKYSFQATAADAITVVLSSSVAADANVVSNVSIGQGF